MRGAFWLPPKTSSPRLLGLLAILFLEEMTPSSPPAHLVLSFLFSTFPSSIFSEPSQLCVLPQAKRSSSDQLWPVISQRKPQHYPLSSHYSLRAHRQACKSMMKRCSNTPQRGLETILATGGACLCACGVFWSKVTVPRRRVSWQSNRKSREIMKEQSL